MRLIESKPNESFLVFTYKDKDGVKYAHNIIKALERAGIAYPDLRADGTGRVNVLTWGRETATNEYAHCDNVVLLGVLFQPDESIAGRFLGQVNDLRSPKLAAELRSLKYSECAHSIYQAINRGKMRQVDVVDGVAQAKACSVYVWHRDSQLEERLAPVLRGIPSWLPWRDEGEELTAQDVARQVVAKLNELESNGASKMSLVELKRLVAPRTAGETWRRARDVALRSTPWCIDGRSLVRMFADESATAA